MGGLGSGANAMRTVPLRQRTVARGQGPGPPGRPPWLGLAQASGSGGTNAAPPQGSASLPLLHGPSQRKRPALRVVSVVGTRPTGYATARIRIFARLTANGIIQAGGSMMWSAITVTPSIISRDAPGDSGEWIRAPESWGMYSDVSVAAGANLIMGLGAPP